MVLKAFTEYTQGPLEVQYEPDGKVYRIPPITIEAAAIVHAMAADPDAPVPGLDPDDDYAMQRLVLGPLWDQMIAEKVPAFFASRVYLAALADFQGGREYAERIFMEGPDPKALEEFLQSRTARQESPKASPEPKRSPRTGSGNPTRSRASTTRTKTSRPS